MTATALVFVLLSLLTAGATPNPDPNGQQTPNSFNRQLAGKFVEAVGNSHVLPFSVRRSRWQVAYKHPAVGAAVLLPTPVYFSYTVSDLLDVRSVDVTRAPRRGRAPPLS